MNSVHGASPSTVLKREHEWTASSPAFAQFEQNGLQVSMLMTAELGDLGNVPERQEGNKRALWRANGALSTSNTALKRAQIAEYRTLLARFSKQMASQTGKAKRAQIEWLAAQEKLRAAMQKADANAELERSLEQEGAQLASSRLRYEYLHEVLEKIGAQIFTSIVVQSFPILETLQWEVDVKETEMKLLPIELDREKRARLALKSAEQCIKDCLKYVRTILNSGIEMGVPQDNKHHQKLFSGSAIKFADSSMPCMLNCKSSLGKYFTFIVQARMRQDLILTSPQFELPDLSVLPGRKKVGTMNELEMYSAMEKCYAQCQACCTYIVTEIRVSVEREKAYRQRLGISQETLKGTKMDVQRARYIILSTYGKGLAEVQRRLKLQFPLADSQSAVIARAKQVDKGETDLNSGSQVFQTADSNSITTEASYVPISGVSTALYQAARQRLLMIKSEIAAQTRVEDTQEDLPWHNLALGW